MILQKIKKRFNNFPLKSKIMILVTIIISLTTVASLLGLKIISIQSDRLLYKALAGSLSYSVSDISNKLSNIESMSSSIISNKDMKKSLITLSDATDSIKLYNASSTLSSLLFDYYQSNRVNSVSFINLYHENWVTYSYEAQCQTIPNSVFEDVIAKSNKKEGYPCWVTDYCNEYGLFLGRDCRRVDEMKYKTLGTLVVNVDMEKLISSSTKSILFSPTAHYILYDNEKNIYHSKDLSETSVGKIRTKMTKDYEVLKYDGKRYFCIRGSFINMPWEYICMIPYDKIARAQDFSFFLSIFVIILAVIISFFFSNKIIHSITVHFDILLRKMDKFGNDEIMDAPIDYNYDIRKDEVGVLHNHFDQMVKKIHQLIDENYVYEILARDAKIKALENQINPHFLYNTLESVNWRAKLIGEKDISTMVEALGSLLRITLNQKEATTTLEHELQIVKHYITIQKIRFEDRLSYEEYIEEELLNNSVPQFILQPLIENAINYALEEYIDTCYIEVYAEAKDDMVIIRVINNGSQFEEDILNKLQSNKLQPHGFGIGLINIHKRIQLIFGQPYGLLLYNRDENHAVAQINIPRRTL